MNDLIVWRPSNSDTATLAMEIRADLKAAAEGKSAYVERLAAAGGKLLEARRRMGLLENFNTLGSRHAEGKRQAALWREWLAQEGISFDMAKRAVSAFRKPEVLAAVGKRSNARRSAFGKLRPSIEELQAILNMDAEDALNWCIAMAKRETRYAA